MKKSSKDSWYITNQLNPYIASYVIFNNTFLLGYTACFATRGDAEGTCLSDGVCSDGRIGRVHMLRKHGIFIALSHSIKNKNSENRAFAKMREREIKNLRWVENNVFVRNSQWFQVLSAFLRHISVASLGEGCTCEQGLPHVPALLA